MKKSAPPKVLSGHLDTLAGETDDEDVPYEPHLCADCAKAEELKAFVQEYAVLGAPCSICARATVATTPTTAALGLEKLMRGLVRYHYSEWDYNGHLGGENIERILAGENPVLHSERIHDPIDFDPFFHEMFGAGYPPMEENIGLYAGYTDSMQNRPLAAISTTESLDLLDAARALETKNYFEIEPSVEKRLAGLVPAIDCRIAPGEVLYRARIGTAGRYVDLLENNSEFVHHPYTGKAIDAPPPDLAAPGRANRQGVSFLYVTSTPETAVAEVRPHPGQFLSVASFRSEKNLRVANFGQLGLHDFVGNEFILDNYHFAVSIDRLLRMPITPEERHKYTLTQLIADLLRKMGFDGIRYSSSVGSGYNICVFSPAALAQITGSERVIAVTGLSYTIEEAPHTADPSTLYRIDR